MQAVQVLLAGLWNGCGVSQYSLSESRVVYHHCRTASLSGCISSSRGLTPLSNAWVVPLLLMQPACPLSCHDGFLPASLLNFACSYRCSVTACFTTLQPVVILLASLPLVSQKIVCAVSACLLPPGPGLATSLCTPTLDVLRSLGWGS